MSSTGLNRVLGLAVISDSFREGFLGARRAEVLGDPRFDLDADERALLLEIPSDDLRVIGSLVEQFLRQRRLNALGQLPEAASQAPEAGAALPVQPAPAWRSPAPSGVYLRHR